MKKLIAGIVASLLGSLIWYLATPAQPPGRPGDAATLRTPVQLVLLSGERISGELQGADALCADWQATLQEEPATRVTLPDGRTLTGDQVRSFVAEPGALSKVILLGAVSACPAQVTVRVPGAAPVPGGLQDAGAAAGQIRQTLKDLEQP